MPAKTESLSSVFLKDNFISPHPGFIFYTECKAKTPEFAGNTKHKQPAAAFVTIGRAILTRWTIAGPQYASAYLTNSLSRR